MGQTGEEGLEPSNDGVKIRCLTTWLHPIKDLKEIIETIFLFV